MALRLISWVVVNKIIINKNFMPDYIYTARTKDGMLKKDRITMKDEKALADYLRSQGLLLTSIKLAKTEKKSKITLFSGLLNRISAVQKIFFTQNLEVMVRTGFSLANALKTLSLQTPNKKFREIISDLQHEVESGQTFTNALSKHKNVFSELFINMISAGEISGKLDESLRNLTIQMKKEHELITKVRSALTYPTIVVIAMVGIGIGMMIFVIPQMMAIFEEMETELPLPTLILIGISKFVTKNGIFLAIGIIILIIILNRIFKTKKGKFILHKILLKLPILAGILKKINLARFSRSLSSLLKTDIPIVQTFEIISKVLGNVHYKQAMLECAQRVKKGISIVKSLEDKPDLFPPIITQMISVGEETGALDTISDEIANFYEADVDTTMGNLAVIIEPVLMLLLGAAVAGMALAIILPMYSLVEQI